MPRFRDGKAMLSEFDITNAQKQLLAVLGARDFNRLIESVCATKGKGRLRFWQELLLESFTETTGIRVDFNGFLRVFENATICPIAQDPWTKEVFLKRIAAFPYGGFSLDETPPDWMREAWEIANVRECLSHEISRDVSKSGSLCCTNEYLSYLDAALTVDQQAELFIFIRDKSGCGSREPEFRPEFEQAFPRCVPYLPPWLPRDPAADNVVHEGSESILNDGDVPF
jgi:hypothetical protein